MIDDRRSLDKQWRESMEAQHRENVGRFQHIETRLDVIDKHVLEDKQKDVELMRLVETRHKEARDAVRENTALTMSIKEDTAAIIAVWKTWTLARKFLAWFIPVLCTAAGAYVTWTLKK